MTGDDVIWVAVLLALIWVMWNVTRKSLGSSGDGFMTKITKLSVLVLLVAGGIVWVVDRAEENSAGDGSPPGAGSGGNGPGKPARDRPGGDQNR